MCTSRACKGHAVRGTNGRCGRVELMRKCRALWPSVIAQLGGGGRVIHFIIETELVGVVDAPGHMVERTASSLRVVMTALRACSNLPSQRLLGHTCLLLPPPVGSVAVDRLRTVATGRTRPRSTALQPQGCWRARYRSRPAAITKRGGSFNIPAAEAAALRPRVAGRRARLVQRQGPPRARALAASAAPRPFRGQAGDSELLSERRHYGVCRVRGLRARPHGRHHGSLRARAPWACPARAARGLWTDRCVHILPFLSQCQLAVCAARAVPPRPFARPSALAEAPRGASGAPVGRVTNAAAAAARAARRPDFQGPCEGGRGQVPASRRRRGRGRGRARARHRRHRRARVPRDPQVRAQVDDVARLRAGPLDQLQHRVALALPRRGGHQDGARPPRPSPLSPLPVFFSSFLPSHVPLSLPPLPPLPPAAAAPGVRACQW